MKNDGFEHYKAFEELLAKYGYDIEEIDSLKYDYNEECEINDDYDSMIYSMSEFDDYFCNCLPSEVVRTVEGCAFNLNDKYFSPTLYGLVSSNYLEDLMDYEYLENALKGKGDNS